MENDAFRKLKAQVLSANRALPRHGLVQLTWGNASGRLNPHDLIVIKPSGVGFAELRLDSLVVVDLQGHLVSGELRPSSDLASHVQLYRNFPEIGGIVHFHSPYACMFAQAGLSIPCLGSTHADHFAGPVPVTPYPSLAQVQTDYEENTGRSIVELFKTLDPMAVPAVLVAGHGPFSWGESPKKALENAIALETVARMAFGTLQLNPRAEFPEYIQSKHFLRKHGPDAYYGQPEGLERKSGEKP